ncbi:MAG: metal-dependent hydrolase [Caldisphaera sp.]
MGSLIYYGHSAFEINSGGKKILVDPWISNPASVTKVESIKNVDLIVLTHGHDDHIGDTIKIMENNPKSKVVAIFELANYIATKINDENRVIGGNMGGPMIVDNIKIALVPANHSSEGFGSPTGAVIITNEGTIYHAGDTGITSEMELIGEIYKPDIALLPIGGHFTMDHNEAAKAVEMIKPKVAIPMHYGTFPVLYGDPNEFKKIVVSRGVNTNIVILKPGEKFEFKF